MSEFKSVDAWAAVNTEDRSGTEYARRVSVDPIDLSDRARAEGYSVIPVTISPRAEWIEVTPDTDLAGLVDEQLWLVLDGSEVVLGTVDAEYDEFHGFTRYSFCSPEKWGEASISVTNYMPAHIPQAPEGE